MAVIVYKNYDKTVATIADRNAITAKIDNMVVTVIDAIADVDAGSGVATYRWNDQLNKWVLISKSTVDTMSFETVELTIAAGKVTPPNMPINNVIWNIYVMGVNDEIEAELRLEDIIVSSSLISGLGTYDGKKLRFTYAYGSITQQIETYMNEKLGELTSNAPELLDTFKEVADKISDMESTLGGVEAVASGVIGTVDDFEGAIA